MARFFFSLHECGQIIEDPEGRDYPDLETARAGAVHEARSIMSDEVLHGRLCLSCCVVIEDEHHHEVARVRFADALEISGG